MKSIELDPWDIVDLLICKRGDQFVSVEFATDDEFDAWVKTNSIPVKENGINFWSFDDRCRIINHVLAHGGTLEFADGTRIPDDPKNSGPAPTNENNSTPDDAA